MLANFLIGLREGLEAGLIVGILVAYLQKLGRRDVLPRLWIGIGIAVALSLGVGAILTWGPYGLSFQAQEILGGTLSILAVALVTWMIFWMGNHARGLKHDLQSKLDVALVGAASGIVVLGFLSVGREGIETALFVWATVNASGNAGIATIGALLGILTAVAISYLIYRGLIRINLSRFFTWTGLFLILVAAGVLAYGIGDLQEAGVIPGWGQPAYSLAGAIPPSSWYGALLGGVFNFTPEPTWAQVIGWLGYAVVVTFFFLRQIFTRTAPAATAPTAARPVDAPLADSGVARSA
ncbi:iron uptake transporter permease EfeU [Leifsonia sp. Leaf264]|uniref:iron uptake transporter permease EfeU n=1 Tax=Leifsonia sp. Leaf264 TaxID=1736314 RepID=UPI0006FD0289|nr:iron uptake transporter permease EfeU [Leifsonia sp. Leaf264]KQP01569.1 high-affinity Fe2+/Pb2+ permease [Leifsonia sp. Leaf264]